MASKASLKLKAAQKLGVFTAALTIAAASPAADLRNFISDLYGGDGITLDRFGFFPHDAHFTQDSLERLSQLNSNISSGVGNFAFNSTIATYTFDVAQGAPVRSVDSLGPILSERAETMSRGTFNVAFSYAKVDFDEFRGQDIDEISISFPHIDVLGPGFGPADGVIGPPGPAFELDTVDVDIDLDIEQEVFAIFGSYGITDNFQVGAILPIVKTDVRASAVARVVDNGGGAAFHRFGGLGDSATDVTGGSETGIGDLVLRAKYRFLNNHTNLPDMAARFQISAETGDEDDLLGTGETAFEGLLIASKKYGRITPHFNVGYEFSTDSDRDNVRYVAGFDAQLMPEILTAAVEVLGRHFTDANSKDDDLIDVSFGVKWDPFRVAPVNVNFIIPVNDDGLRSDLIWSVGFDYTF